MWQTNLVADRTELSTRTVRWIWATATADVMAAVWMYTAGEWFDAHRLTSVFTLGGHHLAVLWLAAGAFAGILVAAVLTEGFTSTSRPASITLSLACLVSVVALAGFLSVVLLVVGAGLLIGLVGRLRG
ncbi:hypothetical protein LWF15_04740 [Kineosporia rhizophila]|uniref:hypothetical protein n=1 Tax=Kineosporia TaxID=49184 RepID=UPI001E63DFD6|nr:MULTISPECIES: hypothetical protein [Kineosporia]MCE0534808.1 hypothetical protein [Kineosporia rhizophila]GLY19263.1 hypothetical protein Kisp01_62770 [Kineosporia sp. NBRC 101677]